MSITLSWTKKDSDAVLEKYEIYRSTDKATLFQAGNLLTTLADKAAVAYVDQTTVFDTPYWYGVRSKTIYGDVDSTPVMLVECTNPGPGKFAPEVGDFADGFVESIYNDQSFTNAANKIIVEQLRKNWVEANVADYSLYPTNTVNTLPAYCINKFWKNGKVLFVPNSPLIGIKTITVKQAYDTIIAPLVAAKPRIEIDGAMYEFGILTRADVLRYIACGSYKHAAEVANAWIDRVTPKTFLHVMPQSQTVRTMHGDMVGTSPGVAVSGAGTVGDFNPGDSVTAPWGVNVAWYFTPVPG
jgi:hypothetical protein